MRNLLGFLSGLIFGLGLIVSGMANPAKVLNFLDLAGHWDPSLGFVMGGAVVVTFLGYRLAWQQGAPILAPDFDVPTSSRIDRPLILGAALGFLTYERRELESTITEQGALYARVLEDHANRTFNAVDLAMVAALEAAVSALIAPRADLGGSVAYKRYISGVVVADLLVECQQQEVQA